MKRWSGLTLSFGRAGVCAAAVIARVMDKRSFEDIAWVTAAVELSNGRAEPLQLSDGGQCAEPGEDESEVAWLGYAAADDGESGQGRRVGGAARGTPVPAGGQR